MSPQRATRPWLGAVEKSAAEQRPAHDPKCYLCASNTRANGVVNPNYGGVYVFDNDFPALMPIETTDDGQQTTNDRLTSHASRLTAHSSLLQAEQETGVCRVICFSPRHDLTLAQLPIGQIRTVVDTWAAQ